MKDCATLPGFAVYASPDDLPPQYRDCCNMDAINGMGVFYHPLMVSLMPLVVPDSIEAMLTLRQSQADDLLARKLFSAYLVRHERAYRMETLLRLHDSGALGDTHHPRIAFLFWKLAAWVWTDCEASEDDPIWTDIMSVSVPHRPFMSGVAGRRALRALPEQVTLYRGVQGITARAARRAAALGGWSWTTDRDVAERFARRFVRRPEAPHVATAVVPRTAIVAYLLGRGEREALLPPGTVSELGLSIERLPFKR